MPAYNVKRLIAIIGIADMIKAIRAFIQLRRLKTALQVILQFNRDERSEKNSVPPGVRGSSEPCIRFAGKPAVCIFSFCATLADPGHFVAIAGHYPNKKRTATTGRFQPKAACQISLGNRRALEEFAHLSVFLRVTFRPAETQHVTVLR